MPKRRPPDSIREPIQVYLTGEDRDLLDRASAASGVSRAEVLRRGLRQYGGALVAEPNPINTFLEAMAADAWPKDMPDDVGIRHDEQLAAAYQPTSARKKTVKR